MITFKHWVESKLPAVKSTGFWTDKFGDSKVDDASVEDLFNHAKTKPEGLLSALRSLQLLVSYGSFPKSKMDDLWKLYKAEQEK